MQTPFEQVKAVNEAFNNKEGNPKDIDWNAVRSQCKNMLDEFVELMKALGLNQKGMEALFLAQIALKHSYFDKEPNLKEVRDALCDSHVFAYGAHHMMGIDANRDMKSVTTSLFSRFIKNDEDKAATVALHASKGITEVGFENEYPYMIIRSLKDQPDAPKGKFLKSASTVQPAFYEV